MKDIIKEFREFVKPALDKGFYKTEYTQEEFRETYAWICNIEDFWLSKLKAQREEILEDIEDRIEFHIGSPQDLLQDIKKTIRKKYQK